MPRIIYLLLFSFCMTGTGYAGVKDSIGVTRINNVMMLKYLVSPGETIYGISTRYHVPITDLLEINPELENGLKVGQVIHIPYNEALVQKENARPSGAPQTHKVQPGETYYSLSRRYNVSVDQLMKWNNTDLKAGQEIIVGYGTSASTTGSVSAQKPVVPAGSDNNTTTAANAQPVAASDPRPVSAEPVKTESPKVVNSVVAADKTAEQEKKSEPVVKNEVVKPAEALPEKPAIAESASEAGIKMYPYDPDMKQLLIIPFDPYLYFSDADHEIAAKSKIVPTRVREVFRRRMTAMMQMPGYESIFLLGGKFEDTLRDLNKIYSSVTYGYQDAINTSAALGNHIEKATVSPVKNKSWLDKQKDKFTSPQLAQKAVYDKNEGQYFGVKIRNPEEFFSYFGQKYSVDYYVFVNQFEVKTNYENCLDRAAHDFERTFTTHFSIFDATGKQVAGNKFKTFYNSNSSYIYTIVADNMEKIAQRILSELPSAGK